MKTCLRCGSPIIVAKTNDGEIVLDLSTRVFELKDSVVEPIAQLAHSETYVPHDSVCRGVRR